LLATGSERYTPYNKLKQPAEILTIANRMLGTGQLSLAKFLFITADDERKISPQHIPSFFDYMLSRIDLSRDIHFHTNTTIDTLDYSGTGLNRGSKVVLAAYGDVLRDLCTEVPGEFTSLQNFEKPKLALPGIICIQTRAFSNYANAEKEMSDLNEKLRLATGILQQCPLIVVCDNSIFTSDNLNNFLWVTFTRSNPAYDIYGVNSFYSHKHWGCDAVIIDARVKPHHAPVLEKDTAIEKRIEQIFNKGGSLYGILK